MSPREREERDWEALRRLAHTREALREQSALLRRTMEQDDPTWPGGVWVEPGKDHW